MDPQTIVPPAPQTDQPAAEPVAAEVLDNVQPQVAEALQKSKNVLVTVGVDPSVDELAAALGLTVLLGKIGKHATAVFSGKTPPAIEFLDPEKTFEDTVDSLRDFIIALDKEKADKLRYKVEDDVVKIFITPYRTVIGEKDLEFSQGDFNVDAVITLGVEKKEELDKAITAHGRILHNATFITVNAGAATTSLGTINWADAEASSIAEMLVRLSTNLGDDVLDPQISTAFLTGIVAETNRFSNEKTTPKVMTMSAQLMAAGANQQLIASNLRQEGMISESVRLQQKNSTADDGEMVLTHKSEKSDAKADTPKKQSPKPQSTPKPSGAPKKEPKVAQPQPEKPEPSLQPVATPSPSEALEDALQEAASEQKTVAPAEPPAMPPVAPEPHISSARKVIIPPSESAAASTSTPPVEAVQTTEIAPPTITPPPARDAMEKPQFGGALNSFADSPSAASEPAAEQFTLTHGSADTEAAVQKEAVEAARKAVEDAAIEPPHQRLESIGATPLPQAPVVPDTQPTPAIEPVMPSLQQSVPQPLENPASIAPAPAPTPGAMPPLPAPAPFAPAPLPPADPSLPPMPASTDGALPPLPPMPGQPASSAPTIAPQTAPSFLQDLQQSQNNWTQAGQSVGEAKAAANAERQTKIEERLQDYDQAVDRNRELQGLPPANNPYNPGGFPPATPPQFPQ